MRRRLLNWCQYRVIVIVYDWPVIGLKTIWLVLNEHVSERILVRDWNDDFLIAEKVLTWFKTSYLLPLASMSDMTWVRLRCPSWGLETNGSHRVNTAGILEWSRTDDSDAGCQLWCLKLGVIALLAKRAPLIRECAMHSICRTYWFEWSVHVRLHSCKH